MSAAPEQTRCWADHLEKLTSAFALSKVLFTDGWNFDWLDTLANVEKEPLSIVMC